MRNITVSVSDKAYTAARVWAAANCTSVSAAVQAYIEVLPQKKTTPQYLELLNRFRQQARARDRAAREETANQNTSGAASTAGEISFMLGLARFLQKRKETRGNATSKA